MKRPIMLDVTIGVLAVLSIVVIVIESLLELSSPWLFGLYTVDLVVCAVFAAEFVSRLRAADDRKPFLRTRGFEILAMIPAFAFFAAGSLPVVSAGLRSLRLIRVVRVILLVGRMERFVRTSRRFAQRSGLVYLLAMTVAVIFGGGLAVFLLEQGTVDPEITNLSDAMWWSISTVTTVGYGDIVPHSAAGRILGMGLMVVGIGVMTAFISAVSATIVEARLRGGGKDGSLRTTVVTEVKERVDRIEELSEDETALLVDMIMALRRGRAG